MFNHDTRDQTAIRLVLMSSILMATFAANMYISGVSLDNPYFLSFLGAIAASILGSGWLTLSG